MRGLAAVRATTAGITLALVGAIATLAQSGCSKDDTSSSRASRRGEVCQVAHDCEDGLFCAPVPNGSGGICVTGTFKIARTSKSCTVVECAGVSDCCSANVSDFCDQLRSMCNQSGGSASDQACIQFAQQCGCASGRIDCELGKCISRCNVDTDCPSTNGGSAKCAGGKCVQCAGDSDCGSVGGMCVSGVCKPACANDGACSGFDRCVSGRCIPSGCQADRECIASTRNVDARCGTDGKCIVPCETDLECGSPTNFAFFACIDKQCTYVGCESDKDCSLFFGASGANPLANKQVAVCQDNGVVGDVTKPAH